MINQSKVSFDHLQRKILTDALVAATTVADKVKIAQAISELNLSIAKRREAVKKNPTGRKKKVVQTKASEDVLKALGGRGV